LERIGGIMKRQNWFLGQNNWEFGKKNLPGTFLRKNNPLTSPKSLGSLMEFPPQMGKPKAFPSSGVIGKLVS